MRGSRQGREVNPGLAADVGNNEKTAQPFEGDLVEESKDVIQPRLEQSGGFEQAVLIAPQQLSHRARGEEAHTRRPHVGGDQIGQQRTPEGLHHRLRPDRPV